MNENVVFAFMLTLFAGMATSIGSLISLFVKRDNKKFLAISLGFSAGVMLYVSFVEIFVKANDSLELAVGVNKAPWLTALGFFLGIALIGLIDKFMSSKKMEIEGDASDSKKLLRMGLFTALALGIHNFPEGYTQNVSQSKPLKNKEKNLNLQMKRKAFDKVFLFLNQKP